MKKLRVAMVYGEFSSAIHGPFDFSALEDAALTGSESSFFNLARTLGERGHEVVVFAPAVAPYDHPSGCAMLPIEMLRGLPSMGQGMDAVVAWNEPDYLQHAPPGALRVVDQQLNDWGYCKRPPETFVDTFVFPSRSSMGNHLGQIEVGPYDIIPNSVDLDLFEGPKVPRVERHPHRVVYCSSPDRGLHHLLSFWPEVRRRVPDAELKIFYRLEPWLAGARDLADEVGQRARYVEHALTVLTAAAPSEAPASGWGVEVVGPVANKRMALELRQAAVLAYPCDPVRYTEGFGVSVLDACAAGCLPIISDADALAEVHGNAAVVIGSPRPDLVRDYWISAIANRLVMSSNIHDHVMSEHAAEHSRQAVADQWERLLSRKP